MKVEIIGPRARPWRNASLGRKHIREEVREYLIPFQRVADRA